MTTLEFWIASVLLASLRRDWKEHRAPRNLTRLLIGRVVSAELDPITCERRAKKHSKLKAWGAAGGLSRSIPLHADQRSRRSGIE